MLSWRNFDTIKFRTLNIWFQSYLQTTKPDYLFSAVLIISADKQNN